MKKSLSLVLFFLVYSSASLFAQTDTVFWFAAPNISHNGAPTEILDRPIYIRVSTLFSAAVVTISEPANPLFIPKVLNIPANTTATVDLTPDIKFVEDTVPDGILNHGILVHSTALVGAYYENSSPTNPEIFALKGKNALGTSFYTPFQNLWQNAPGYHPTPYSAFDIVATQDNTVVTIVPIQNIIGHVAGSTFSVTLNKGQTYSGRASSSFPGFHLGGSKVSSDKPIAVTVKDDLLLNNNFCADLVGDQIVPISIIGTEYIVINGFLTPGAGGPDKIFILATQNNTSISINGTPVTTINDQQTFMYTVNLPSLYVKTSAPVYVLHASGFGCELGAPVLPPINCTGSRQIGFTRSTSELFALNIITKAGQEGNFILNGSSALVPATAFTAVPGAIGWVAAQISFSVTDVPVGAASLLKNTAGVFHMGVINGGSSSGCRYGYFSDYNKLAAQINYSNKAICVGDKLTLDAGGNNDSYLWSNGATTQTIDVDTIGNYSVTVKKGGCVDTAKTHITMLPRPVFKFKKDTTFCSLPPHSITLDAGNSQGFGYSWNTTPSQTTQKITVSQSGKYAVTISNAGCGILDTITVNFNEINVHISQSSAAICHGDSLILDAGTGMDSYLWNNGRTSQKIQTDTAGKFWVTIKKDICSASDTLSVTFLPHPINKTTHDTTFCSGLPPHTQVISAEPGFSYSWHTTPAQTTQQITVSQAGTYAVDVFNAGCLVTDSIAVNFNEVGVHIHQSDAAICKGDTLTLDAGAGMDSYLWSTGSTTRTIAVSAANHYWVKITKSSCSANDTLAVTFLPRPVFNIAKDTAVCSSPPYSLHLNAGNSDPLFRHHWSTGEVGNTITVTTTGVYADTISNDGCQGVNNVHVKFNRIPNDLVLPNVFTPNGDGDNDGFAFTIVDLDEFHIDVYNRWGLLLFTSEASDVYWDGRTQSGVNAPAGTYFWILRYRSECLDNQLHITKGFVTLLR